MFVRICKTSEIQDGEMNKFEVEGKWILIARSGNDFHVADSNCTHQESDLSLGLFSDCVVTCPLHQAKFDLKTGEVLLGPDGGEPSSISKLRIYSAKIEDDEVFVDI